MTARALRLAALFLPLVTSGCPAPSTGADAGGDAEVACATDRDCDDGLYCDGTETCDPGASGADARGCVEGTPPCSVEDGCDEAGERCLGVCGTDADHDGDGEDAITCGGADCDDDDRARSPTLTEFCDAGDRDEDCDPRTFGPRDADGDGSPDARCCNVDETGARRCGDDCDDARAGVSPAAPEVCDRLDNDCDGGIDEGALRTFYVDADADGRGNPDLPTMEACLPPAGYVEMAGDCDDTESSVHTGGTETCDAAMLDEDCDGVANPDSLCSCSGTGSRACLAPGVCRSGIERCVGGSWGLCSISPSIEICNGLDDDCDGTPDEELLRVCFSDPDDDTWATAAAETMMLCPVSGRAAAGGCPIGFTSRAPLGLDVDCDESSDARHPTAIEACDGRDEDCDGASDEGLMLVERYVDLDGDGVPGYAVMRCEGDPGSVAVALDCNEGRTDVYRGAPELCDRVDNNCGLGGAAAGGVDVYEDQDDDGFAPPGALCTGGPRPRTDCNDDPAMGGASDFPGATEVCSGRDTDCDGVVDDEPAASLSCSAPRASAGCASDGACHMLLCDRGYGDCNADPADGCETALATSPSHCGDCGLACGAGAPCLAGLCDGIANVAAAFEHTCVRFASGAVSCAGENRNFTLGDGTRTDRSFFVRSVGVSTATSVRLGQAHSCAVLASGGVSCWGSNLGGALGDGTTTDRSTAVAVVGLAGAAVEVAPGNLFTCARLATGAVQCWGQNTRGQLGNGTTSTGATTAPVSVSGITSAISVSAHGAHACAVLMDGTVRCWGANDFGALGDGTTTDRPTPVAVAGLTNARVVGVGNDHACALRADGSVWCWGRSGAGRLGDGSTTDVARAAAAVTGLTGGVTSLSAGDVHTCVVRGTGQVSCWGQNTSGQVGDGTTTNATTPRDLAGIADGVEVAAGGFHTCVLRTGGRMACWGQNTSGQLVTGTLTASPSPQAVPGLHNVAEVVGGSAFECARRTDGAVACWGDNRFGALGIGSVGGTRLSPAVTTVGPAIEIGAASEWACAIDATGQLSCWGRLASGDTGTPVAVAGIDDAVAFDAGLFHGCVLRESGELWCWGDNGAGQLGSGSTATSSPTPVRAGTLTDVRAFSCSRSNTCAVRGNGELWCWGGNSFGQIGTGSTGGTFRSPRLVTFAHDYVDVEVSNNVVCARRAIGTLECWGSLLLGGVRTTTLAPRVVTGLPAGDPIDSLDLDLGDTTAIVVTLASGRAYAWGSENATGELGLGHLLPTSNPSAVIRYTDFDATMTGVGVSCGIRDMRRSLACWGAAGRLGDGTSNASSTPVDVVGFP